MNGTTSGQPLGPGVPLTLSGILSLLLSFGALREWLKLIVIGGVIETCRRSFFRTWDLFIESFWITASFDEMDTSYNWIMFWLSKQPKWSTARVVDVSTRTFGLASPAVSVPGDVDEECLGRKLCYLPSFSQSYSLWYRGHYLTITRIQAQSGLYNMREVLQLSILSRSHSVLNDLLMEAKKDYIAAEEHLISIFVSESSGSWRHVASRPKRPLKSIVLDPGIKDLLLDDARDFLQSKDWYFERGIPFRRGYLLYGAPGSGKTSMIHSLAGELGLDVYIISLSRLGLDDTSLSALISDLPERCIALMEDIDAAFHQGLTRDFSNEEENLEMTDEQKAQEKEKEKDKDKDNHNASAPLSRVTLSGLLNALDGIAAQEGRILYATTNRYSALDPALCRPGRMDLHIEFKLASKYQAGELFKCFYLPSYEDTDDKDTTLGDKEHVADDSTTSTVHAAPEEVNTTSEKEKPYSGNAHRLGGSQLPRKQVIALAERFADAIPEREVSMASLQGYLMSYKIRPTAAVDAVPEWIEKERMRKNKKSKTLSS